jgi:hypothetical protein
MAEPAGAIAGQILMYPPEIIPFTQKAAGNSVFFGRWGDEMQSTRYQPDIVDGLDIMGGPPGALSMHVPETEYRLRQIHENREKGDDLPYRKGLPIIFVFPIL